MDRFGKGLRRRVQRGFTLIELTIGIAVLTTGLMGLAAAMISAYKLDRLAKERKIALAWAASTMEMIRNQGPSGVILTPAAGGYLVPSSWTSTDDLGFQKDYDSDGDEDFFGRYYYSDSTKAAYSQGGNTAALYDSLLQGLTPQPGTTRVGEIYLRDPDGTTGVSEGDGYWVTVRVQWRGMTGNCELKMASYISK